jgi:RimJ/RimL family protein N-acetyltransferase
MAQLVAHTITLRGERVTLRPLTEADWPVLLRWNSDPEVLYFSEGDDVQSYSLEEVQGIYRSVSQSAYCFMIEYQGRPVGEGWLQRMNIERILNDYPGFDLRRIDLLIGEKALWGQGLGTEAIRLLTDLAFQQEGADYVFAVEVADTNSRSRRAFEKNGYRLVASYPQPPGGKARQTFDLLLKNPRSGAHAYAAQLFFDSGVEQAVRAVWREMAESGSAPYFDHSAERPHFTLSVYRSLDLAEARRRLADLASGQARLPVSFHSFGLFPSPKPAIFLGPLVTIALLELHTGVHERLDGLGEPTGSSFYLPGRWVPHCSLAIQFDSARMDEAWQIARRLALPLAGEICEIGLIEISPARHLGCWPLASAR